MADRGAKKGWSRVTERDKKKFGSLFDYHHMLNSYLLNFIDT